MENKDVSNVHTVLSQANGASGLKHDPWVITGSPVLLSVAKITGICTRSLNLCLVRQHTGKSVQRIICRHGFTSVQRKSVML